MEGGQCREEGQPTVPTQHRHPREFLVEHLAAMPSVVQRGDRHQGSGQICYGLLLGTHIHKSRVAVCVEVSGILWYQ